jgi:hypothetical protein
MAMDQTCVQRDMIGRRIGYLVWGLPVCLVLFATFLGESGRALVWTTSFSVMGGACVLNAARCGRLHCFITGPLYLIAALASLLEGLSVVSLGWQWIGYGALSGTLLAFLLEWTAGRYASSARARTSC